jgi:hypothetical protein
VAAKKKQPIRKKATSRRKGVAVRKKATSRHKGVAVEKKAITRRKSTKAILPKTIDFHYLKGPDFRSVHIDGAIGGLTTKGFLHIALFAERAVIPQKTTYNITDEGTLGDEIVERRESKNGIVRQMEIDLIVNEDTAIVLRNWLDQRIEEFEQRRKDIESLRKGD